jgi:hypothetical protein
MWSKARVRKEVTSKLKALGQIYRKLNCGITSIIHTTQQLQCNYSRLKTLDIKCYTSMFKRWDESLEHITGINITAIKKTERFPFCVQFLKNSDLNKNSIMQ